MFNFLKTPACFGILTACAAQAGPLGIKYNATGTLLPKASEYGVEAYYRANDYLIPFARLALQDRDYAVRYAMADFAAGRAREKGYRVWIGNRLRPFKIPYLAQLEIPIYYRRADLRYDFTASDPNGPIGSEKVRAHALGSGLAYTLTFWKHVTIEPFWYVDYGHYRVEPSGEDIRRHSPYAYAWDDENLLGVNLGLVF